MADFSTGAELEIEVSQRSLSAARDTIESELGDLEVGVDAVVSGNRQQPRDPSSGQFMAIEGVEQRQVNTNETLDGLVQIETERWELDKRRNDYLEQLAETSMLPGGGQQAGGGGTTILGGTGLLGSLGGATTALGGGGALAGAFGLNELFGARGTGEVLGRAAAQSGGNPAQFGAQAGAQIGRSIGLGEEAQAAIEGFGQNLELPNLSEQSWPSLPNLADEADWPGVPDLSAETDWPGYPNLSEDQDWPSLPNLADEFEWPKPDFDFNPFDDQPEGTTRGTRGPTQRGPNESIQTVEPTVNIGGVDVKVPIDLQNVGNTVDDLQRDLNDLDQDINNLERRISETIEGFF